MFQKALGLHQRGQLAEAEVLYRQALSIDARHFDSLHLLGLVLVQSGQTQAGIASIRKALLVRTDFAGAWYNLGHALLTGGEALEALACFNRAIALQPGDAQYHLEAGNALKDLKRNDEAIAAYDAALRLEPGAAEAFNNRGIALKDSGRPAEAVASYDAAIRLRPRYAEAHSNRGNALKELGRLEEALACQDAAIGLRHDYAEAHYNRGNVLGEMKRHDQALASFDKAVRLRPDYAEAHYNKALLLLGRGNFSEGFGLYHWRWRSPGFNSDLLQAEIPPWDGKDTAALLLWPEQGIGDEILYASLLALLPPGTPVTLAADRRLRAIYERSFPHIRITPSAALGQLPAGQFSAQAAVGDLGTLLAVDAGKLASRPSPFLVADAQRRSDLLAANPAFAAGKLCGLSWKSANPKFGKEKSLRLIDLAPLLTTPGITFVNLQYGEVEEEIAEVQSRLGVTVYRAEGLDVFSDIDGLLALVDACEEVLTTSNITAHLAGALAKPAVVMVPAGKGCLWYWQGGANNLWYPSLRRVAQESPGQWAGAVAAAVAAIKERP
jgi:tetratricopeptide (TPR) repeat protein